MVQQLRVTEVQYNNMRLRDFCKVCHLVVMFHVQVRGPTCARVFSEHLNKAVSEGNLVKVRDIVVLEHGFNGWAKSGRPVCSCSDLVCTHRVA